MDAATTFAIPSTDRSGAAGSGVPPTLDAGRIRDIVLVRVATAGKVLVRSDLAHDLWPIVSHLISQSDWTAALDRDLGALADAGLCEARPVAVSVTEAGRKRAALVLGVNVLPRSWGEAKGCRLVAKALGLDQLPARRLKPLSKVDGLRAAIVQQAYKIKLRGLPTPARLRSHLATLAVSRAFGDTLPSGVDDKSGLSAKVGRNLAGRLAHPPRDFATDSRLIAALAAEYAGTHKADIENLQTALLRRYVTRGQLSAITPQTKPSRTRKKAAQPPAKLLPPTQSVRASDPPRAQPSLAIGARPDFATFITCVRTIAARCADGWPGNRKAFVSKVWGGVQVGHPEWQVTVVEFKAMLAEAHRAGHLVLANADLKDERSIAEIQASAIAYKNAIFHYVRVDD